MKPKLFGWYILSAWRRNAPKAMHHAGKWIRENAAVIGCALLVAVSLLYLAAAFA